MNTHAHTHGDADFALNKVDGLHFELRSERMVEFENSR